MDRNDKFRKRLENKLNQTMDKAVGRFDPTPYVNILMDNIHWEDDDEEELENSLEDININPNLDFILGRSSLLNPIQKKLVIKALQHRLISVFQFDAISPANELLEIWGTKDFEKYQYVDEDGEVEFDFSEFFDKHNFTKEQRTMVTDCFFEQIGSDNDDDDKFNERFVRPVPPASPFKHKIDIFAFILLVLIFVGTPSCFIPNYLQSIGWLSPNAGWFMKIAVGIMSAIAIIFIWRKIINFLSKRILKINNSK
jgi:hypothetical protein